MCGCLPALARRPATRAWPPPWGLAAHVNFSVGVTAFCSALHSRAASVKEHSAQRHMPAAMIERRRVEHRVLQRWPIAAAHALAVRSSSPHAPSRSGRELPAPQHNRQHELIYSNRDAPRDIPAGACRRELLERGRDPGQDLRTATRAEMHAAAAALGRALKFDCPPFEWVYEGYKPLLLPDVVALRRGAPVALATAAICVLRRLGLSVVPHFPHHGAHARQSSAAPSESRSHPGHTSLHGDLQIS